MTTGLFDFSKAKTISIKGCKTMDDIYDVLEAHGIIPLSRFPSYFKEPHIFDILRKNGILDYYEDENFFAGPTLDMLYNDWFRFVPKSEYIPRNFYVATLHGIEEIKKRIASLN